MATKSSERKNFFKRIGGKDKEEPTEMNFFDHIEELRWHLIRSVAVWLIAVVLIFVYVDWVYDNIILAPTFPKFFTYGALCNFWHWLHLRL